MSVYSRFITTQMEVLTSPTGYSTASLEGSGRSKAWLSVESPRPSKIYQYRTNLKLRLGRFGSDPSPCLLRWWSRRSTVDSPATDDCFMMFRSLRADARTLQRSLMQPCRSFANWGLCSTWHVADPSSFDRHSSLSLLRLFNAHLDNVIVRIDSNREEVSLYLSF